MNQKTVKTKFVGIVKFVSPFNVIGDRPRDVELEVHYDPEANDFFALDADWIEFHHARIQSPFNQETTLEFPDPNSPALKAVTMETL